MKYAIYSAMLYLGVILQTTLLPRVNLFGVQPDLLCALLVPISIVAGPIVGTVMGALTGLVLDLMFMHPGFYAVQYMLICLLAGLAASRVPFDRVFLPLIACFVCFVIKEMITLMYLYLNRVEINFAIAMSKLLLGGVMTVALTLPLHQLVRAFGKIHLTQDRSVFGNDRS